MSRRVYVAIQTPDPEWEASLSADPDFPVEIVREPTEEWCRGLTPEDVVFFRSGFATEIPQKNFAPFLRSVKILQDVGARIVNPPASTAFCMRKDFWYPKIAGAPPFFVDPSRREIEYAMAAGILSFPFVYRDAGGWGGRDTFLIQDWRQWDDNPLTERSDAHRIVVPYYEGIRFGGYYQRYRLHMIGGACDVFGVLIGRSRTPLRLPAERDAKFVADFREAQIVDRDKIADEIAAIGDRVRIQLNIEVFAADVIPVKQAPGLILTDVNPIYAYSPMEELYGPGSEAAKWRKGHFSRLVRWLHEKA